MSLFRGSRNATTSEGEIVATAQDILESVNRAISAKDGAQAAESAAQAAQLAAEGTLEDFETKYLGAKTSDPATDNAGDPLIDGALYYNTDLNVTKVYDVSLGQWANIGPSSAEQANINTVAAISDDVENVSDIDLQISDVASIKDNVTSVADNIVDVITVSDNVTEVQTVSGSIDSVDVIASDLAGAGFDYDLGSITQPTEGVVGTPDGYIITLFDIRDDITAVAAIDSDITATVNNISDIETVASDLNDIVSDINTVSGSISNVNTTAANIADVNTVAGISNEVNTVAADEADIGTVSSNITDVNTVSNSISDVSSVAAINSEVVTVAGIDTDVTTVSGISSDVTEVSGVSSDVSTVSGISSDVTTVAANLADVTNFADVYIGPASSDPSTRSDGSALQSGDLYFNTTDNRLKVYDGSQWEVTARDDSDIRNLLSAAGDLTYNSATGEFSFTERTDAEVRGLLSATGDLSYNATTGEFSVTTYKSSDFDTDFNGKSTSDLTEGTNLYYTETRVNDDIDARVDKTFVDALNVDSDTLDGQEGTYYLDRANHTGTQTLSTISDSGALAALDEVDTAQIANQAVTEDKLAASLDLGSI